MASRALLLVGCLLGYVAVAPAAQFVDPFRTFPSDPGRQPFAWDQFNGYNGPGSIWSWRDGAMVYNANQQASTYCGFSAAAAGVSITDETQWSLEVGFRYVSGSAPPDYLFLAYTRWNMAEAGQMRIVGLSYDPAKQDLLLYNAVANEPPVHVDLSGDFHAIRLICAEKKLRLFVDGKPMGGPYDLKARAYGAGAEFLFGPLTQTKEHSLRAEWSDVAFSDEGAFAPGEGNWTPASAHQPIAKGLRLVQIPDVFKQPRYPGIQVVSNEKGTARWEQAVPDAMKLYRGTLKTTPAQLEVPLYSYQDQPGPSKQNVYNNAYVLRYDDRRCVANAMLTRGVGDTATGYMDYKMWYRVSLDGGKTYGDLKPIVQQGPDYSPMHPIQVVWVGKNSFCYATIPGTMLKLSNSQVFFPCYYAPLDAEGNYYNPLHAYTFGAVIGIIGTWNAAGDDLLWDVSEPVLLGPEQSSRGADECGVIELAGKPGRLLMVIRASNEPNPTGKIPAWKWKTVSNDYGKTWSKCEPFTFEDGEPIISPSSCCSLIRSSRSGKCYWVGNISRTLPKGNSPRYPLVIAEVDEQKLVLRRHTLTIIDDRHPDDPADLQLSNYNLVEDAETGEFVLEVDRYMADRSAPGAGPHTFVIRVR